MDLQRFLRPILTVDSLAIRLPGNTVARPLVGAPIIHAAAISSAPDGPECHAANASNNGTVKLILAHGASGNAQSMKPWVAALRPLGVDAVAIDLPRGKAERAVPAYRAALHRHPNAAIGGHSFGGRVASLLAAEESVPALVCLSYPLHPPGRPNDLRTDHWPNIACPVLLLSGERDQFATIELLRDSLHRLKQVTLFTYPAAGHGLLPVVDDAAARVASFLAGVKDQPLARRTGLIGGEMGEA